MTSSSICYRSPSIIPDSYSNILQPPIFSNHELINIESKEEHQKEETSSSVSMTEDMIEKESPRDQLSFILEKLLDLRSLSGEWCNEEGNVAFPNDDVFSKTKNLIVAFATDNYYPNRITPSIEEGLCLEFEFGQFRLYLEIYNDDDIGYIIEDIKNKEIVENNDIINKAFTDKIVADIIQSMF